MHLFIVDTMLRLVCKISIAAAPGQIEHAKNLAALTTQEEI